MTTAPKKAPVSTHRIASGKVNLAAYTQGNPEHTPVVLIHGYPDNHEVWNEVAEKLAKKFFVVRYDVRGAGASDRPRQARDYTLQILSDDLVAVLDKLVPGRAVHLVGHDWGSIQTWESITASHLQHRILSYSTISGPSLDHVGYWMRKRLLSTDAGMRKKALKQLSSSWYIMLFQLPFLAPNIWRLAGDRLPRLIAKNENIPYKAHASQVEDGIFGINLYRANFIKSLLTPRERYTDKPVQLIVAEDDNYVGVQLFEDMQQWVPNAWRRDVKAGHWTLLAEGEKLAGWIADFATQVETGKEATGLHKLS